MNTKKLITEPYIEKTINKLVQEETGKRQYYRPVYSIHKWWARRPGALFRSIILLATAKESEYELFKHNNIGYLSEKSDYFDSHDMEDIVILDPFMGGGTTLAESNRIGIKTIGCDINPVSFWIVRETLKPINIGKLDQYFNELRDDAGEKIRKLYVTKCPICHDDKCESLYTFWLRFIKCLHCGNDVYLTKRSMLNEGLSRNKPISFTNLATVFCPYCHQINNWNGQDNCICSKCARYFNPRDETYGNGYYKCSHCNQSKISLIQTIKSGQKLQEKILAIEYWCPQCKQRLYKNPDENDIALLDRIKEEFKASYDSLLIPKQSIAKGSSSERWRIHNYNYYHELFNERQLLSFNYLLKSINNITDEEYRNAFMTVFSNCLEYNNMMTPYNYPHRKLHHLFNYHALPLTTTPVENCVWGVGKDGAGTFINCYQRYIKAKEYCQNPYDKYKEVNGEIKTIYAKKEKISANLVSSFDELKQTPKSALLLCGDSSKLDKIPDKAIDLVITDPPYFDNIHYSELSNFFYVWLSLFKKDNSVFASEYAPTEQEAIVNRGMDKDGISYQKLLHSVFLECNRVLKANGLLIFTYHHTKIQAWWTLFTALIESGFCVIDSFPIISEYKVNPHVRNKQTLDIDLVLVCNKTQILPESASVPLDNITQHIIEELVLDKNSVGNNELYLRFIGKLLKALSLSWNSHKLTYEEFSQILLSFDKNIQKIKPNLPKIERKDLDEQLVLF